MKDVGSNGGIKTSWKIYSSIKARRTLGKIVKSSFSEFWKLARGLQQSEELLLKKNSWILVRTWAVGHLNVPLFQALLPGSKSNPASKKSVVMHHINGIKDENYMTITIYAKILTLLQGQNTKQSRNRKELPQSDKRVTTTWMNLKTKC